MVGLAWPCSTAHLHGPGVFRAARARGDGRLCDVGRAQARSRRRSRWSEPDTKIVHRHGVFGGMLIMLAILAAYRARAAGETKQSSTRASPTGSTAFTHQLQKSLDAAGGRRGRRDVSHGGRRGPLFDQGELDRCEMLEKYRTKLAVADAGIRRRCRPRTRSRTRPGEFATTRCPSPRASPTWWRPQPEREGRFAGRGHHRRAFMCAGVHARLGAPSTR